MAAQWRVVHWTVAVYQSIATCDIQRFFCQNDEGNRTRSSWLNCALRDDEAMYWLSLGHCETVAVGN